MLEEHHAAEMFLDIFCGWMGLEVGWDEAHCV